MFYFYFQLRNENGFEEKCYLIIRHDIVFQDRTLHATIQVAAVYFSRNWIHTRDPAPGQSSFVRCYLNTSTFC